MHAAAPQAFMLHAVSVGAFFHCGAFLSHVGDLCHPQIFTFSTDRAGDLQQHGGAFHSPSGHRLPPPACPRPTLTLLHAHTPAIPALRSRAVDEGRQRGRWVLSHCCLLTWVLYLTVLALRLLSVPPLVGWRGCVWWGGPRGTSFLQAQKGGNAELTLCTIS